MNSYNRKIADRLLHNELKMIHNTDQPEMFNNELESLNALHESVFYGGARPLKYVQAGETVATSEPSTLSVGSYPFENVPDHLVEGGNIRKRRGRPRKEDGGNIFDTIGTVTKTVAPLAIPMMMAAGLEKKKRGRPSKGGKINVLGTLKKVGRTVAPVVQKVAVPARWCGRSSECRCSRHRHRAAWHCRPPSGSRPPARRGRPIRRDPNSVFDPCWN